MAFDSPTTFSLYLSAFILTAVLLLAAILSGNLRERVFRLFFILLALQFAGLIAEFTLAALAGTPGRAANIGIRVADFFSYSLGAMQLMVFGRYLYTYLSLKTRVWGNLVRIFDALGGAIIVVAGISLFHPLVARLDGGNHYYRGGYFWVPQVLLGAAMAVMVAATLRCRRALGARELASLLLYAVIPVAGYLVELTDPTLWVVYFAVTLSMVIIYINIQVQLKEKMKEQELALAESRISVMLSQIQPHFLYNSLCAIDKLCYETPEAHEAVLTFSEYLRGNMDALTQKEPIPFARELEHTRQYLWLEELRFGARLRVVYDLQAEDFVLPVLTLQPVVENAVRHGVTKKPEGGTVTVRTRQTEHGVRITVEDDGVGFVPGALAADGRSHTGLANVRGRLAAMCGGSLSVCSAPGKGTTAVIEIPQGNH